jgi:hypothetical protein
VNKVYLIALMVLSILIIEVVGSSYFKILWFSKVNNNVAHLDTLDIRIREGWFPTFNTREDFIFKIYTIFNHEHSQTKSIIFKKSKDDNKNFIEIDLLSEETASKINKKVNSNNVVNTNIGPLYFALKRANKDGEEYVMYFSSKYNITVTIKDAMDLMDIIEVNFTDAKEATNLD